MNILLFCFYLGASVGGVTAAYFSKGFQPVSSVIKNMKKDQQEKLFNKVETIWKKLDISDGIALVALVQGNMVFRKDLIGAITNCLNDELGLQIS